MWQRSSILEPGIKRRIQWVYWTKLRIECSQLTCTLVRWTTMIKLHSKWKISKNKDKDSKHQATQESESVQAHYFNQTVKIKQLNHKINLHRCITKVGQRAWSKVRRFTIGRWWLLWRRSLCLRKRMITFRSSKLLTFQNPRSKKVFWHTKSTKMSFIKHPWFKNGFQTWLKSVTPTFADKK